MTTINPETQIVASRYDDASRMCSYTYQHSDGSLYTVEIPLDELHKAGPLVARRRHLATRIMSHIQTMPPDDPVPEDGKV